MENLIILSIIFTALTLLIGIIAITHVLKVKSEVQSKIYHFVIWSKNNEGKNISYKWCLIVKAKDVDRAKRKATNYVQNMPGYGNLKSPYVMQMGGLYENDSEAFYCEITYKETDCFREEFISKKTDS